jgi:hypothetical protein
MFAFAISYLLTRRTAPTPLSIFRSFVKTVPLRYGYMLSKRNVATRGEIEDFFPGGLEVSTQSGAFLDRTSEQNATIP